MGKFFTASLLLFAASFFFTLAGCGSEDGETPKVTTSINNPETETPDNDSLKAKYALNTNKLQANRYDQEDLTQSTNQYTVPDAFVSVLMKTNFGDITLKLNKARSPATVENFLNYAQRGFYTNTIFHQVQKKFILVGGGYTADLKAKPTRTPIRNEAHNGLKNKRGTIAMRRFAGIHSATSQFIFNMNDNGGMDHVNRDISPQGAPDNYGYCVFGEVTRGWEVIEKMAAQPVKRVDIFNNMPTQSIVIQSVEVIK